MDESKIIEDIKRRLGLLEAAVFSNPANPLPEDRFGEEKPKKIKKLREEKVKGYIASNSVSKTELVEIAKQLGIRTTSLLSTAELIDIILGGDHTHEDPLKEIRDRTEAFITENNIALSTMKCDLKCQTCPENRVVLCQLYNKSTIDSYFNEE